MTSQMYVRLRPIKFDTHTLHLDSWVLVCASGVGKVFDLFSMQVSEQT